MVLLIRARNMGEVTNVYAYINKILLTSDNIMRVLIIVPTIITIGKIRSQEK